MEDSDFQKIEEFLKAEGNMKAVFLQKFEGEVDNLLKSEFSFSGETVREDFLELLTLINTALANFYNVKDNVIKNFGISLVLIKTLIKNINERYPSNDSDQGFQMNILELLKESLKEECKEIVDYFTLYSNYIDKITDSVDSEN